LEGLSIVKGGIVGGEVGNSCGDLDQ